MTKASDKWARTVGGKGGKGKKGLAIAEDKGRATRQSRAKLVLPVARIKTYLKGYAPRVSMGGGAVFCAGSLEFMLTQVLKKAVGATRKAGLKRITAFAIQRGLWRDAQLYSFFRGVHIREGGVPHAAFWERLKEPAPEAAAAAAEEAGEVEE